MRIHRASKYSGLVFLGVLYKVNSMAVVYVPTPVQTNQASVAMQLALTTQNSDGIIFPAMSAVGYSTAILYVVCGGQWTSDDFVCTVEMSPSDTGDDSWFSTGISVEITGTTYIATPHTFITRRVRVRNVTGTGITDSSETATLYFVMQ